ncbi:hypothetical protein KDK_58940 [Dictyobacter kobayashii]|uniref:Penicillin amidase n=2 Tax=Dictyobacter kobayashii TaxID=2014872 RepID=A0A402ASM1_9CHLR|nr:hypothetical protein KDK_58940 [Dictyobacter kobayashii]
MLGIVRSTTFVDFKNALRSWHAPTQNFVYADKNGNIGMISAGYFPQVKSGQPWLPLSGTGEADVIGTIPFDDLPQAYDPPDHMLFSANQRVVTPNYPYYIGTSLDFFDPGYRADTIYHTLNQAHHLTIADMQHLQQDTHDYLAQEMIPKLLTAISNQPPRTLQERQIISLLRDWDGNMSTNSVAATFWIAFGGQYLYDTFHPWWQHFQVPEKQDNKLAITPATGSAASVILTEDLENWTLHDPQNAAFSLPNGTRRVAAEVMRQAFSETVVGLADTLGNNIHNWQWGQVHSQVIPSLSRILSLGTVPRPDSGNSRTVNAADGAPIATAGPSWRFIMDWGSNQGIGIYPGGQSENPVSDWYDNQLNTWWTGHYYPMYTSKQLTTIPGLHTWTLQP